MRLTASVIIAYSEGGTNLNVSKLEKVAFASFPICVITAIFVFVGRYGWGYMRLEMDMYAFMVIASAVAYYLIKKTTVMIGNFSLNLWNGDSFKNMPVHVLLLRYKISIYFSLVFALFAFGGGIYMGNDLFVLFSWTVLGFTVASQQLLGVVEERASVN